MRADTVPVEDEAHVSVLILLTRLKTCFESMFDAGIDDRLSIAFCSFTFWVSDKFPCFQIDLQLRAYFDERRWLEAPLIIT